MEPVSLRRIQTLTLAIGLIGALVAWAWRGPGDAGGFLVGAAFSLVGLRSWRRLAEGIGAEANGGRRPPSVTASALFLSLRYALLAGAIYVIVNVLGVSPASMAIGLLASFVAVGVELIFRSVTSK